MKSKKLYYIPGLISIIGLPVLLIFWGPKDPADFVVLKMNLPSPKKNKSIAEEFTNAHVYRTIKNKKIITIDLDDQGWDERSNYLVNRKYSFVQSEMERLQFTADTNSVLKIHFGSSNNYSDFIWVLNRAIIYDFRRYALVDENLYFLPTPHNIARYETMVMPLIYDFPERKEPTQWEIFKTNMRYKWNYAKSWFEYLFYDQKQNRLLAVGFLLLILVPGIAKIRKYRRSYRLNYSRT